MGRRRFDRAFKLEAVKLVRERGDREAMARLATLYERGLGVRKDRAQARLWRQKSKAAAKAGEPEAAASRQRQ